MEHVRKLSCSYLQSFHNLSRCNYLLVYGNILHTLFGRFCFVYILCSTVNILNWESCFVLVCTLIGCFIFVSIFVRWLRYLYVHENLQIYSLEWFYYIFINIYFLCVFNCFPLIYATILIHIIISSNENLVFLQCTVNQLTSMFLTRISFDFHSTIRLSPLFVYFMPIFAISAYSQLLNCNYSSYSFTLYSSYSSYSCFTFLLSSFPFGIIVVKNMLSWVGCCD